jgi:hypothetical protein
VIDVGEGNKVVGVATLAEYEPSNGVVENGSTDSGEGE